MTYIHTYWWHFNIMTWNKSLNFQPETFRSSDYLNFDRVTLLSNLSNSKTPDLLGGKVTVMSWNILCWKHCDADWFQHTNPEDSVWWVESHYQVLKPRGFLQDTRWKYHWMKLLKYMFVYKNHTVFFLLWFFFLRVGPWLDLFVSIVFCDWDVFFVDIGSSLPTPVFG